MGLLTPDTHRETFANELSQARADFDRNELDSAFVHATNAYEMNPYSEDAALLYGYINLSLAGADPFSMAKKMNESEENEEGALTLADGGAADTLTKLQTIIGLTDDQILQLGKLDVVDPDLPILIPKCAEDARETLKKLNYIGNAIDAACPFVDINVPNQKDVRQLCYETKGFRKYPHKAHFLWAFAHLTEALAFNSVLKYGSSEGQKSNLELRVDKLQDQDASTTKALDKFIGNVETVEKTVDAVMPTGKDCSETAPTTQLIATLNDLLAVDAAFDMMPGMPEKITKSLKKNIAKIKEFEDAASQTKALKADMAKKMSQTLSDKLDSLEGGAVTAEKATELCKSYDSISGGGSEKPELCGDD